MATETYSPKWLAVKLSAVTGRTISPKQVRGRVRGDAGAPLLARFGPDVKGSYASHVYTAAEANKIGAAFVEAHNRRNAAHVKWAMIGARAVKPATPKPAKPASAKPATVATVATPKPEAPSA